jgi:hypothetical protein
VREEQRGVKVDFFKGQVRENCLVINGRHNQERERGIKPRESGILFEGER